MTRNKKIGLLWLLGPFALLVLSLSLFAITTFVTTQLGVLANPIGITEMTNTGNPVLSNQSSDIKTTVVKIISLLLSLLGIIAVIMITIGIPIGIHYLTRKNDSLTIPSLQKLPAYARLNVDQIKYIHTWSWTAFLCGLIWTLGNRLWLWAFLTFIPLVNLYVAIKLAKDGRQIAWEKGSWENFEQFKKRQKNISLIGVIAIITIFILQVIVAFSEFN